jgi:outer membrane murein-binding lipoprotein Lpp
MKIGYFKIGLTLLFIIFLGGAGCVDAQKQVTSEQEKKIQELTKKIEDIERRDQEPKQEVKPAQQKATSSKLLADISNNRIKNQLISFDDLLETTMIDTYLECNGLAVFNNLKHLNDPNLKDAFPEPESKYIEECRQEYVNLLPRESRLIAEPELSGLRKQMTLFITQAKGLAQFALNGGYDAGKIDEYDKNLKSLLTECREEILQIKRKFNIDLQ